MADPFVILKCGRCGKEMECLSSETWNADTTQHVFECDCGTMSTVLTTEIENPAL